MNEQHPISFLSGGLQLQGRLFSSGVPGSPGILFIGGANSSPFVTATTHNEWRVKLCKLGISSFTFDFPGIGNSEGKVNTSSLNSRLSDTQAALASFLEQDPLVNHNNLALVASSMGGHIAARLCQTTTGIKAVILDRPAAYSAEAENKYFDETFTKEIRKKDSWFLSPAFDAFNNFSQRLLVCYGSREEVIPLGIQQMFLNLAKSKGENLILPEVDHFYQKKDDVQSHAARGMFIEVSTKFLLSSLLGP